MTSTVRNIPSEVLLSRRDGMPHGCAVNCDHIQTVSRAKVGAFITVLSPGKTAQVRKAVAFALDF